MFKHRFIGLLTLCCLCVTMQAQEKYNQVLEQAEQLSPYEAIYLLMDYQTLRPELAAVYYQLGDLHYSLLPSRDPLHHYSELKSLLYQARLYYGNGLHFAKDQKLPGWQYAGIANGQKKIEYAQLEQYIRTQLDDIKRRQTACDSIHNSFCRMAERYNRCQLVFSEFLRRYTREKTAHLQLRDDERAMLVQLQLMADSLDNDIAAFQQALTLQPIEGYEPVFRKEEIALYRLDGLTYTDFLQNDIAIWDYSRWVKHFLNEQTTVYERLYADLQKEQEQLTKQLSRYHVGRDIAGAIDESLMGRCKRLGLKTAQVDSVKALQQAVLHGAAEQTIAKSADPQSIREMIPLLQIAAANYSESPDSAQRQMFAHLIRMAQPLSKQQQAVYIHPVTGETIQYPAQEGETVLCLMPDDKGYRCVVSTAEHTRVLMLYRDLSIEHVALQLNQEEPLLYTKIPGNKWVLITDKNLYLDGMQ